MKTITFLHRSQLLLLYSLLSLVLRQSAVGQHFKYRFPQELVHLRARFDVKKQDMLLNKRRWK